MNVLYPSGALVFGLLSVITNGLSGWVLYCNPALTYGSPIIYYFVTLTCMYFLKGLVTVSWSISVLVASTHDDVFFRVAQCAYWTTTLSLFLTLFAMTVERYVNTVSLKRFQWLRARKTVYIYFCLIIVLFSLICGQLVAPERMGPYVEFFICLLAQLAYISATIIFTRCWIKQNSVARETARRQKTNEIRSYKPQFSGQKRLNIVVLCYIVGTLVTILPFFVATQIMLVGELAYNKGTDGHLKKFLDVYSMFTCLNYSLTPLFYFCVLPQFKRCLYLLLSCQVFRRAPLEHSIVIQDSEETTSGEEIV